MTHPALSAPADVIYFVGWITPRPKHHFACFLRFTAGSQTYHDHDLGSGESRSRVARVIEDHLKRSDWRVLEAAVSIPGGFSASAPLAYHGIPVLLWPREETLNIMKNPSGHRPGGGAAA